MSYVKITGTNIGNCLTGFGIHYPITVYNSGNSEILYSIKNSNNTNFDLSKNSFAVDASSFDTFDIFYKPTISSGTDEITDLTISSISVEDGSIDPSGDITLNLTGTRLTNITGGNPRSFRVVSNFAGPYYDFYWKAPTGISGSNLHNYFITGYTLQLSTNSNFSSPEYTKEIKIAQNNSRNPDFSTYYGFSDDDIFFRLDKNSYSDLDVEISYYARLYTAVAGNTGVSVYASGVKYANQPVSNEVFIGYSGTPINIKIEKQPLNFYITPDNTWFDYTYDLYSKLIEYNLGSTDFKPYSEINVYLPENTVFESKDLSKGAIDLNGSFLNFTGSPAGADTCINFYVPSSTEIRGRIGNGMNLYFNRRFASNQFLEKTNNTEVIPEATNSSEYSDSTNGGPAISLKAVTIINEQKQTDIKYNIYSKLSNPQIVNKNTESTPKIASGSGGGKAGFLYTPFTSRIGRYYFYDTINDNLLYNQYIPCNGTLTKNYLLDTQVNRKWWYWYLYFTNTGYGGAISQSSFVSKVGNPYMGYGEMGCANITYSDSNNITSYIPESNYYVNNLATKRLQTEGFLSPLSFAQFGVFYPINILQNNRQAGNLVDIYTNATVNFSLYNNVLPSDYVFRFDQSGISNSTDPLAKSWSGSGSYVLENTSGANEGAYIENYKNLGSSSYKAVNLKNNQFLKLNFASSVTAVDFDLFFICSFDNFIDPTLNETFYISLFDWCLTSNDNNITVNQFSINQFDPLKYTLYPKENLSFFYKNTCLQNKIDVSKSGKLTLAQLQGNFNNYKISKQLNSLCKIDSVDVGTNFITTTQNHNLNNGDIIGFVGDNLPNGISSYDMVSPYTKEVYYVINSTSNTFQISKTSSGSAIDLTSSTSGGIIYKISSNSLYRPFILQIRRVKNEYYYYLNRKEINKVSVAISDGTLINNLQSTTLKLINRGSIGINYFDCTFYNRLLNNSELDSAYSYFVDEYFNLFAGEQGITSLDLKSDLYNYRLPNIFSIAGKV